MMSLVQKIMTFLSKYDQLIDHAARSTYDQLQKDDADGSIQCSGIIQCLCIFLFVMMFSVRHVYIITVIMTTSSHLIQLLMN